MLILKPDKTYTTPTGRTGTDFVARIDGLNYDRFNNNQITIYLSIYENMEAQTMRRPSTISLQETVSLPDLNSFVQEHSILVQESFQGLIDIFQVQAKITYLYLMSLPRWQDWQSDEV